MISKHFTTISFALLFSHAYGWGQGLEGIGIHGIAQQEQHPSNGEIRYVATDGDDENDGTHDNPWRTVQHAVNNAKPGFSISIGPGLYGEPGVPINFHAGTTGEAGNWITINGSPGFSTIILGGFNTRGGTWIAKGGGWIRFKDLTIKGGIFVHNTQSAPVEIINNKFNLLDRGGIAVGGSNHQNATQKNVLIKNNHIYGATYGINTGQSDSSEGWQVIGNSIERIIHSGSGDADYIRVFGKDHVFRGNWLHGTIKAEKGGAHTDGFQTFTGGARNIIIENNILSGFDQGIMASTTGGAVNSGWIIRNNIFSGTYKCGEAGGSYSIGIHPNSGTAEGWIIVNNIFANNRYHGLGLSANASQMTVKNNLFFNSNMYTSFDAKRTDMYVGHNMTNRTPTNSMPTDIEGVDADSIFSRTPTGYFCPVGNRGWLEPKETSPTIGAGVVMDAVNPTDFHGKLRRNNAWDIGPYEFFRELALHPIGVVDVAAGDTLHFVISATSPDGGPLTFTASGQPTGAY
jgi:hypothetical protein